MRAAPTDAAAARRALASRVAGLYALTPDDDGERLVEKVRAAIAGGATAIQYRHKRADAARRRERAAAIGACCREGGALFVVNDGPALAAARIASAVAQAAARGR